MEPPGVARQARDKKLSLHSWKERALALDGQGKAVKCWYDGTDPSGYLWHFILWKYLHIYTNHFHLHVTREGMSHPLTYLCYWFLAGSRCPTSFLIDPFTTKHCTQMDIFWTKPIKIGGTHCTILTANLSSGQMGPGMLRYSWFCTLDTNSHYIPSPTAIKLNSIHKFCQSE